MNTLIALALAGGALWALDRRTTGFGGGASSGSGAGSTFGINVDGNLTPEEAAYCDRQRGLFSELQKLGSTITITAFCNKNPSDPKCLAVDEVNACNTERELDETRKRIADNPVWDAITSIPGAIVDGVTGLVSGVFGDAAWILVAGGVAYLVLR